MNRQRLILAILLLIFVIAVTWSYTAIPRPKTVDKLTYAPGQRAKPAALTGRKSSRGPYDGRVLAMDLLEQEQPDFTGYIRNIFKPIFLDEQMLLRQKAAAIKPPQLPPVQKPAPVAPVAALPESAPPLARFTFLGFLKKDAQRTIFLAKDKDIILVKKGDKVAGRYEATSINEQALTLHVTDTGEEIVIPLIENRPLSAGK
ncbi:MAG: hypothetical protein WCP20_18700 [Desulfuromonadales bacterium]